MFGGWISDKLLKATGSANLGRKPPIVAGLLMASCIITANWLQSDLAVILVMSFAFFGQGMVGLGWTLISDIAPKGLGIRLAACLTLRQPRGDPHPAGDRLYRCRVRQFLLRVDLHRRRRAAGRGGLSVYPRRRQTYRVIAVSKGARHGD